MSRPPRCGDLDAVLSAYVDHEATPEEVAIVEAHALSCSDCAARLRRYQTLTPRLEADVRALLFKSEMAAAPVLAKRTSFPRNWERSMLGSQAPVRLLPRLATVALVLGMAVLVGVVLSRSAPPGRQVETGAQRGPAVAGTATVTDRAPVQVVTIDGLVDTAVASYVHRAVSAAAHSHASALVVVLDASGGLDGSVQQVAQDLATSSVPILAYLTPGRTEAADTSLAAASGLVLDPTTTNLAALLSAVDGREARTSAGAVTLATDGARIDAVDMEPLEALGHRLLDPTTAYLLFVLGLYAVFLEFAHPGSLLPGATGVVCLTLASVAFGMLPTNWLGVSVLVVAVGLMALELKAATHGALVFAGVACLVVGSVLLYSAPGSWTPLEADVRVAPAVLIGAAITGLSVGLLLARVARRIHDLPPIFSLEQLIGAHGESRSGLAPDGVVHVGGQLWSARVRGGRLEPGQPVRVVARHGLVLEVESAALGAATRKGTLS